MTINRADLILLPCAATNVATAFGTAVPINQRRYIYKIHTQNLVAGVNTLTVSWGPVAGITANFQTIGHTLLNDQYVDPDVLLDNALPLYIINGTAALVNFLWLTTAVGNCTVTVWYEDED